MQNFERKNTVIGSPGFLTRDNREGCGFLVVGMVPIYVNRRTTNVKTEKETLGTEA